MIFCTFATIYNKFSSMKILKKLAFAFLVSTLFCSAQATPKHTENLGAVADTLSFSTPLPFDDGVKVGTLPNGFQYFIRKNIEPKNRVTMYLAVKVGSVLEKESQLGLAHFLEHMNFNGLKHFPKNELVNYLQKVGVSFGSDLNAYTGFDETVYQLPIPSDDPEILKNGLQVMRDWAQDALLTGEEIDKERGVVLEEMRGGRGARQRMQDKYFPVMLNNSIYANRLPIGTEPIITNFPYEELRKFHKDWYRPDLQSIIIVGDIDVNQMENEVKRLFSDMKTYPNSPKREIYNVPLTNKNQFISVTDSEMTAVVTQLMIKHPKKTVKTVGDYRNVLAKVVYSQMVNNRLNELLQTANPPFMAAGISINDFVAGLETYGAHVVTNPNEYERGVKALIRELERVQKFGFTQTEFDRAISVLNKNNETSYIERNKIKSDNYVKRYLNFFLKGSPALSSEDSYQITKKVLPTLTVKDVNDLTKEYYTDTNRDIIILAPEKEKSNLPSESQINTWITQVETENIEMYEDRVSDLPLLSKQPQKGSVVSEKNLPSVEAKELTLSNGVRVVLKSTNFKNDEILISAYSPGGTSLYNDNDYYSALYSASLVGSSGVGQLNAIELRKYLTGKNVRIGISIGEINENLSASSDKEGLETTFELIHGFFTEPRIDDDIFQSTIATTLSSMANRENNPDFVFERDNAYKLYNGNIRRIPSEEIHIKSISKERALQIYKDRFADASDFVFVIVGSFNEEEIKPYLEKYLASLPSLNRNEKAPDLGIYEPKKGFKTKTNKGQEQKAKVYLDYYGDFKYSPMEILNMRALESVLTIKLIERLREEEGGVYGTSAQFSGSKYPKGRFTVSIGFGTSIKKYPTLVKLALEEIEKIKKNGPSQADLDKFKIERQRQMELYVKENSFWRGFLMKPYQDKEQLQSPEEMLENLKKIDIKSVKKVANKYLKQSQLFEFVLLPDEVK